MKDINNPDWTDRQHAFQNALHIIRNNPDEDELKDAVELLELVDSTGEIK